eukprot:NODE_16_length_41655_cov_0.272813.p22 type:complete len:146 gc:universal NODE_16_length_41655_cov_0.272813:22433-21996(-)
MQFSKVLRQNIPKEFAEEIQGKVYNWQLPSVSETKVYPNTSLNDLSRNGKEFDLADKDIKLVKAVYGGYYKDLIPEKPDPSTPSGKLLYNAWITLIKNKTYSFQQKKETLALLRESLIDSKKPLPLKASGIIPGQMVKRNKKMQK